MRSSAIRPSPWFLRRPVEAECLRLVAPVTHRFPRCQRRRSPSRRCHRSIEARPSQQGQQSARASIEAIARPAERARDVAIGRCRNAPAMPASRRRAPPSAAPMREADQRARRAPSRRHRLRTCGEGGGEPEPFRSPRCAGQALAAGLGRPNAHASDLFRTLPQANAQRLLLRRTDGASRSRNASCGVVQVPGRADGACVCAYAYRAEHRALSRRAAERGEAGRATSRSRPSRSMSTPRPTPIVRRYLNQNVLPPVDAVRVEEMVNYFDYAYHAAARPRRAVRAERRGLSLAVESGHADPSCRHQGLRHSAQRAAEGESRVPDRHVGLDERARTSCRW